MKKNINSHFYKPQPKQIIFMRHGRVGRFPTKSKIYMFLYNLKTLLKRMYVYRFKKIPLIGMGIRYLDSRVRKFVDSDSKYEKLSYRKFMKLMMHKIDLTLVSKKNCIRNCINVESLPLDIEVIYHSPAKRSLETAEYIRETLNNKPRIDSSLSEELAEVRFDDKIVTKKEYKLLGGLSGCRQLILRRWYYGKNVETLQDTLKRAEQIGKLLMSRPESKILVITHGWYLRLLFLYFNSHTSISFEDLIQVNPPGYGEFFQVCLEDIDFEKMKLQVDKITKY